MPTETKPTISSSNIKPEKITTPIQLLAAWLVALITLVGVLTYQSGRVTNPIWLAPFYAISSVAIIPVFLGLIFLLQTKFRKQILSDKYYVDYEDIVTKHTINPPIELPLKHDESKQEHIAVKKKNIDYKAYFININRLLDNYDKIVEILFEDGMEIYSNFGLNIPLEKLITFSINIHPKDIAHLLKILLPLGFNKVNIANDSNNSVYIGSYAYEKTPSHYITESLIKILESTINVNDLKNIITPFDSIRLTINFNEPKNKNATE